jgi:hypothetical protein
MVGVWLEEGNLEVEPRRSGCASRVSRESVDGGATPPSRTGSIWRTQRGWGDGLNVGLEMETDQTKSWKRNGDGPPAKGDAQDCQARR